MIKVLLDLLVLMRTLFPLIVSTLIFALLFILLAKSIKKYYYVYYAVFAVPFVLFTVPFALRLCGVAMPFSFTGIPVLGEILRDYVHMAGIGHPLLIIVMYIGALNMKNPWVKRLMSIRKEISVISGFPILVHSLVRTLNNFPSSLKYFTRHAEFMSDGRATNALGAGISNTALVLGIVMLVLFLILWITSFDAVRRRMGGAMWKKTQRWSYVLYALMFIHAAGIQTGSLLNPRGGRAPSHTVEATAPPAAAAEHDGAAQSGQSEMTRPAPAEARAERGQRGNRGGERTQAAQGGRGHGTATGSLADVRFDATTQRWASIASLLLIYGSYLILRLRKAKRSAR
jgi:DMSO/TMAO reductase YedYZ heme-binding membrane subunit